MMRINDLQWMNLYHKFVDFAATAKQYGLFVDTLNRMERSMFDICPLPRKAKGGNC